MRNQNLRLVNGPAEPVLHLRYNGESRDFLLRDLGLAAGASDVEVRQCVARVLDVELKNLASYVVERHENGNWTVRPEAVFG